MGLAGCALACLIASGCATAGNRGVDLAAASGDLPLSGSAAARVAEPAGILGSGAEGSQAAVRFADGSSASVALGGLYYAASGRWCRRYQIAEPAAARPTSTETACQGSGGWHRSRPVVVTGFGTASRS
jgi:hypothetical protein